MAITFYAGPNTLVKHNLVAKEQKTKFFSERDINTEMPTDGDSIDCEGAKGAVQLRSFAAPKAKSMKQMDKNKILVPVRMEQASGKGSLEYVPASEFGGGGGTGRDPDGKSINITEVQGEERLQIFNWARTSSGEGYKIPPFLTGSTPLFLAKDGSSLKYLQIQTDMADNKSLNYLNQGGSNVMQLWNFKSPNTQTGGDVGEFEPKEESYQRYGSPQLRFLVRDGDTNTYSLKYINLKPDPTDDVSLSRIATVGNDKGKLQICYFDQIQTNTRIEQGPTVALTLGGSNSANDHDEDEVWSTGRGDGFKFLAKSGDYLKYVALRAPTITGNTSGANVIVEKGGKTGESLSIAVYYA